jgi:hypothetical protein
MEEQSQRVIAKAAALHVDIESKFSELMAKCDQAEMADKKELHADMSECEQQVHFAPYSTLL